MHLVRLARPILGQRCTVILKQLHVGFLFVGLLDPDVIPGGLGAADRHPSTLRTASPRSILRCFATTRIATTASPRSLSVSSGSSCTSSRISGVRSLSW